MVSGSSSVTASEPATPPRKGKTANPGSEQKKAKRASTDAVKKAMADIEPLSLGAAAEELNTELLDISMLDTCDLTKPPDMDLLKKLEKQSVLHLKGFFEDIDWDAWRKQLQIQRPLQPDNASLKFTGEGGEKLGATENVEANEERSMVDSFYGLTSDDTPGRAFFRKHYEADRDLVLPYVKSALSAHIDLSGDDFSKTVVRHLDYQKGGGVGEHTDYGFLTFQISNEPGLEVFLHGKWYLLPPGAYVYGGDMTERLTNGAVKAMKHRVRNAPYARGAHVFFTQPSDDLVIKVAEQYVSYQDPPLPPVRYGDWHDIKVTAAFGTAFVGTKVADITSAAAAKTKASQTKTTTKKAATTKQTTSKKSVTKRLPRGPRRSRRRNRP
jgi:hypothetical protein